MAQLSGTLYLDVNANGIQDIGLDQYLEGWTVFVDYNGNGLPDAGEALAVTASDGSYTITGIQNGTYEVRILSATGDRITYDATTGAPTNLGGWLPSEPLTYDPVTLDRYYIASFSSTGTKLGSIDFEDAALRGLTDNSALTADNQVWSGLGLKFWLDSNRDFIGDATQIINGVPGGTMYVEQRGGSDTTSSFVNDFTTGPFDLSNRFNRRVFDTENAIRRSLSESSQAGLLGTYFLRGGGLFTTTTVPTFLIEYTTPTAAAKGWVWDIDTTWNEQLQGLTEKWRVEWFNSNQQLLGFQDSPAGESVWIPTSVVNANPTLYANTTRLDTDTNGDGILDADLNPNWSYNYNSLDAKLWEWSFARQQADVSYVRITFTGQKTLNTDVGFAFDRFDAFAVNSLTADFGMYQLATLGDRVWLDTNANGIQDAGESGIAGVSVQLLGSDGASAISTTTTGADGSYLFSNLTPGTYYVRFIQPDGYAGFSP
ncbi:SdrD B-like domain-containing protein, partial [Pannus brasiliensis CCIBt3594]